jgi:hypothetical protein
MTSRIVTQAIEFGPANSQSFCYILESRLYAKRFQHYYSDADNERKYASLIT